MPFLPRYVFKHWAKRFAACCFDAAGAVIFFPFRSGFSTARFRGCKKILVIRLDHVGDVVMTRPALRALRDFFPEAKIDFLVDTEVRELFEGQPEVDRVFPASRLWFSRKPGNLIEQLREMSGWVRKFRREGYDLGIDFRGDLRHIAMMAFAGIPLRMGYGITGGGFFLNYEGRYRKDLHQVDLNLKLLEGAGVAGPKELLPFSDPGGRETHFWSAKGREIRAQEGVRIVIHPSAGYSSKEWPFENFRNLISQILKRDLGSVRVIGTASEKEKQALFFDSPRFLDLRGKTALADLPRLFEASDIFIGGDSGPAHLAAAQGMEILSLFSGANDVDVWKPWTRRLQVIQHAVTCSPCGAAVCPLGHQDCMKKITVQEVLEQLEAMVRQRGPTLKAGGNA